MRMENKRTSALIILFILMTVACHAQLKTWLTLETGPQWSMLKVADPGGYFEQANVKSSMAGITVGQEIIPNLSLVTGLLFMPLSDGINMADDRPGQSSWRAGNALMLPIRAEYRIRPTEYPVSFSPRIGYIQLLNFSSDSLYTAQSVLSSPDGTPLSYDIQQSSDSPGSHMLEIGMGINLIFPGNWQATMNLSYMTALFDSPSDRYTLDYTNAAGNATSTSYTSKGNTLYTSLAFNIPLSNIWQNKNYRIRARIENSVFKGKPVERKGQIYVGGEIGALWRQFNSNNPAVNARPIEGRGIFRYSNLHTGIYAGYMLSGDLGIDVGINYQRSSTFFALAYDHEVDFVTKLRAPLYLEIPVRVRYFYDIYKERIHLAVYGGASLLTHFSSTVYNQGTGDFNYTSPATSSTVSATTSYSASRERRMVPLLRLGGGVEYLLPLQFPLIATLYLNYMHGYMETGQIDVSNTVPESPAISSIAYNGTGWSLDLGVKIPFKIGGKVKCGALPKRE